MSNWIEDDVVVTKVCRIKSKYNKSNSVKQPLQVTGITVDNHGNIYFTNYRENIYQVPHDNNINTEPQILVNIPQAKLQGIVWSRNKFLYMCDHRNHRILSYSIDTKNVATVSGNGKAGHKDGNMENAEFFYPQGIAMDRNGDLYITQFHSVRKINLSSRTVMTIAGSNISGHKDGDAAEAAFIQPKGIVLSEDAIYVAEELNECIRKIKGGIVSTLAGAPGKTGYKDGHPRQSRFRSVKALVMDAHGNLFIGDNNGLRRMDLNQQKVTTVQGIRSMNIHSLAISTTNKVLFIGGHNCVIKIGKNTWKWKRWIWIGHLKENPNDCLLANLPTEIIKEIAQWI